MAPLLYRAFLGVLLAFLLLSQARAAPPDSLAAALQAAGRPDSARVRLLLASATKLRSTAPDLALSRAEVALALARQVHNVPQEIELELLLGRIYNAQGNSKAAVQHLLPAMRLATAAHDTLGMAHANLYLGTAHKNLHQYEPALAYAQAARYCYERAARQGAPRAARGAAVALNNSGTAHMEMKHYPAANADLRQALRRGRALGDSGVVSMALFNLGTIALTTKQGGAAYRYYHQTLAIDQAEGNKYGEAESWLNLGDALALLRRTAEARAAYDHAHQLARQLQAGPVLRVVYDGYARLYEQTSQPAAALRWQKRLMSLSDSLFQLESAAQVTEMRTKFETEQKEAANRLQAAQLRTQQQVIRRRNVQLWAGLAVVLLLAGLAYLLYNRRRLRQQVAFAQERRQLEHQRVAAVFEAEEKERQRIGADLHDGVGQVLSAAKLNLNALERLLPAAEFPANGGPESPQVLVENTLSMLETSFQEVRDISHNLVPNALLRRGLATAVREFLSKMTTASGLRIEIEVFGLDQERLPGTTESVLFRVVQELVQNIVKHARASQLTIQLIRTAASLTIMVEDNGVGFDAAALGPAAGIGLQNIKTRLAYLGGTADFDSSPGHGTTVTLEVPVAGMG